MFAVQVAQQLVGTCFSTYLMRGIASQVSMTHKQRSMNRPWIQTYWSTSRVYDINHWVTVPLTSVHHKPLKIMLHFCCYTWGVSIIWWSSAARSPQHTSNTNCLITLKKTYRWELKEVCKNIKMFAALYRICSILKIINNKSTLQTGWSMHWPRTKLL